MGISLGLVGLGSFGSQFAKLFKAHPDVDRIALCDSEPEKVKKFLEDPFMADKVSAADCYSTLTEICQADLDGLVIITQPWLHAPQCIEAMQSGKHVYSAVPLITIPDDEETLEWAAKILQTSRSSGCQYMLGETTIYRAQTMFCRRMAAEGAFGEYVYSEGEYVHDVDGGINGGSNLRKVLEHRTTGVIGSKYNALMEAYTQRGKFGTPMNYPTHSIAGPINVMQTRALKVSAYGTPNSNNDPYFKHDDFTNISALYQLA
ncbi:MAG: Gfo/Idh/MocA family oxidoreductase, partial [Lentisphaeria bacterium]